MKKFYLNWGQYNPGANVKVTASGLGTGSEFTAPLKASYGITLYNVFIGIVIGGPFESEEDKIHKEKLIKT